MRPASRASLRDEHRQRCLAGPDVAHEPETAAARRGCRRSRRRSSATAARRLGLGRAPCPRPAAARRRRRGTCGGITEATPRERACAHAALTAIAGPGDILGPEDPAGAVAGAERAGARAQRLRPAPPSSKSRLSRRSHRGRGCPRAAGPRRPAARPAARLWVMFDELREAGEEDELAVPIGPLRCLAMITSAIPSAPRTRGCSTRRGRGTSTRSASCSIAPDSRRSERIGRLSGRCSGARESWETAITGTSSSPERSFRPRLNWLTCSTRLARGSSARISWM